MNIRNAILISIIFLVFSCKKDYKKQSKIDEAKIIASYIENNLGLKSKVIIKNHGECQLLSLHFLKKTEKEYSFFLDNESNNIIADLIYDEIPQELKNNCLKFAFTFQGYPKDSLKYVYRKEDKEIKSRFQNNILFRDFAEYSIKELGYIDVLRSTQFVKYIRENFSKNFDFKGSYWELLEEFASAWNDKENNINTLINFLWYASVTSDEENPLPDDVNQKGLTYILSKCNIDTNILKMDGNQIVKYVSQNFDSKSGNVSK